MYSEKVQMPENIPFSGTTTEQGFIKGGTIIMNTMPRPEHPLPQWERSTWKNLNGEWDFSFDFGKSGVDRCFYEKKDWEKKIIVPFCPESDLSGIGYKDYMDAVWYHKTVELTEVEVKGRVLLHFGAVDYDARVWINGTEVGRHKGGYTSFTFDITAYVQAGANDIAVYAEDDLRSGKQPHGKQSGLYYSHGCEYTRTTGIWQTVWLEFVPENYVKKARFFPNVEAGTLTIEAVTVGDGSFCAEAFYEGKRCGQAETTSAGGTLVVTLPLSEVHLWEAGAGRLYDLTITFGEDTVHSYFGLRNVTISGEKVLINGKSVFQRLVLDQGFYPDGIYTASTDEALENDVKLSMAAGFNGARLHEKVFEPFSCSSRKISFRRSTEISRPASPAAISWFWQNTHRIEQPPKNTAPEPAVPEMHGSSQ